MVVPGHQDSVSISLLAILEEQRSTLMTYTYRISGEAPQNVSISPLRGGDGPAWQSLQGGGMTYDL